MTHKSQPGPPLFQWHVIVISQVKRPRPRVIVCVDVRVCVRRGSRGWQFRPRFPNFRPLAVFKSQFVKDALIPVTFFFQTIEKSREELFPRIYCQSRYQKIFIRVYFCFNNQNNSSYQLNDRVADSVEIVSIVFVKQRNNLLS